MWEDRILLEGHILEHEWETGAFSKHNEKKAENGKEWITSRYMVPFVELGAMLS